LVVEVLPYFYDAEQIVYIIGSDDKRKPVTINEEVPQFDPETQALIEPIVQNNIKKGKYSVTIDSGPSYQTKRIEQADTMNQLVKVAPQIMQIAPDLVFKVQDIPGADEFAERARVLLPPPIQQMLAAKEAGQDPEKAALLQQLQQGQQQLQQMQQGIEQLQQSIQMLQKDKEASIAASNARQAVAEAAGAQDAAKASQEAEVRDGDRQLEREKMGLEREKMGFEREKMAHERLKMEFEAKCAANEQAGKVREIEAKSNADAQVALTKQATEGQEMGEKEETAALMPVIEALQQSVEALTQAVAAPRQIKITEFAPDGMPLAGVSTMGR
jgi:hypothetical protein